MIEFSTTAAGVEMVPAVPALDTPVPPVLAAALVEAWAELDHLKRDKSADVGTYTYNYADLAILLEMARPILARHGLALIQPVTRRDGGAAEVETWLLHRSGHMLRWVFEISPGNSPQQLGSAITYARRYSAQAALGVAAADDDGQAAATVRPERKQPPRRQRGKEPAVDEERQRAHAMVLVDKLGLGDDREGRLALWGRILNRTVTSWNDLTNVERNRLIVEMQAQLEAETEADNRAALWDAADEE